MTLSNLVKYVKLEFLMKKLGEPCVIWKNQNKQFTKNDYDTKRVFIINRVFEGDMAEIAMREEIGLLAYSPMAFGVLSGKYIKGTAADNARLKLFPRFARYSSDKATEATKRYMKIAEDNNMTLAQMSLAFVTDRPFMTSNIIGATSLEQLEENIDSANITLSDEILKAINEVHAEIPNPAP